MDAEILAPLTSLEARLNTLLAAITSTPTASGAPAATVSLLEADDALTGALKTLRVHQANYSKILRLRAEAVSLEERVRETVRQVGELGDEISAAAGDDEDSDEDSDTAGEAGSDLDMGDARTSDEKESDKLRKNEVDYKLLLGFARRISKYNNEAAADASSTRMPPREPNEDREGQPEANGKGEEDRSAQDQGQTGVGIASLPQDTVSWLDETANWTRVMSALPYPSEDRIRMGLMGQLNAVAAAEGKDVDKEVDRVLAAAGQRNSPEDETETSQQQAVADVDTGAGGIREPAQQQPVVAPINHQARNSGGHVAEPVNVKPKLDLDLYDPDEDDM
ncbi:uncharacterized protein GIQ15_05358 [Arthroderma uncinatum]|uniref:uncharacterized protein n=1 Tax=Arthroderma uncinatum TaxID=74035 RepID=UPI00144ACA95|nr:uncharacterized protein GIQ15_05358 [Arthroderma uncinatum]KAF3482599.1 hypothetical protein GIQ15_05358 [Arthroderma uncinatum]